MMEPRYSIPKDIPPSAQATEQKLRQIREDATVREKAEAWRVFLTRRAA